MAALQVRVDLARTELFQAVGMLFTEEEELQPQVQQGQSSALGLDTEAVVAARRLAAFQVQAEQVIWAAAAAAAAAWRYQQDLLLAPLALAVLAATAMSSSSQCKENQ